MSFINRINKAFFNLKFLLKLHKRNFTSYFQCQKEPLRDDITTNSIHWMGHATTVINLNNKIIVTDPVLGSLGHFKRLVRPSLDLKNIPIDYILLSHGHMDHLDFISLAKLNKKSTVIAPKNYVKILKLMGYKKVISLNTFNEYSDNFISIKCFPSNHDGRRYYLGNAYTSNAYLISSKDKKVFFAGDTAYTEEFKDIKCDLALMPVGCYMPKGFDKMHCTPEQSFNMFKMMDCPIMVPIHYGTFIISLDKDEDTLKTLENINDGSIKIINVGKTIDI